MTLFTEKGRSFLLLLMIISTPLEAQEVHIYPEVTMLALGDSYPDYIATTGWTTRNLIQGIRTGLNREKQYQRGSG